MTTLKVKIIALVVFVGGPLLQANPVFAQSGMSVTVDINTLNGDCGIKTITVSGTWSTPAGDTVGSLVVFRSTDGGKTFSAYLTIPAKDITGAGGTSGTYSTSPVALSVGDVIFVRLTSSKGLVKDTPTQTYQGK
jgi:hypothetical protein